MRIRTGSVFANVIARESVIGVVDPQGRHSVFPRNIIFTSERGAKEWNWQGRISVRGKLKWMEFFSNQESKSDGSIVRRGIIQDITARKDRADESEVKYLESIELLPIGIIIHKKGKLLYFKCPSSCHSRC